MTSAVSASAIDLHTHSTWSDGTLAPTALVREAVRAGIAMLALTDHDTTSGLAEAAAAARAHGLQLVPGVELSASWRAQTIHILGLWIDPDSDALQVLLSAQKERRQRRLERMCERLGELGLPGDALRGAVIASPGVPTRAHLAAALVEGGYVRAPEEAFRRFLGAGKAAHVSAGWPGVAEIVAAISQAGGCATLAHPTRYRLSAGARRALLQEFTAAGGRALEIVSGGHGAQHADGLAALALRHGLAGSVGSDFHGPERTWNPLGRLAKLPDLITPVWRGITADTRTRQFS